jgi:predicted ATPase/AraC-like DNA-binding protein
MISDERGYNHRNNQDNHLNARQNNIPVASTPILGRKKELEELLELLKKHPVVTITGAGGIGKTRISLELCQNAQGDFQDGIVFISMATLANDSKVTPVLANALGITESASRELSDGLYDILFNKEMLLVIDNLEHIASAGPEISQLIVGCPDLTILCTSRTPLKIQTEQEYPLSTLPIPVDQDLNILMDNAAIKLFVSRAQRRNKNFSLDAENADTIIKICQNLDGLPLALELAAARMRILSPDQLLKRLKNSLNVLTAGSKDLPERHQTLRATINWSYTLLTKPERELFRKLAVFANGFTLEAVEIVCYDNEQQATIALDEIESLLDNGLLERDHRNNRFNLLQTIKDFASEKLDESGESDLVAYRHAQYFFEASKILSEGARGKMQRVRMEQGIHDEANHLVALDYLLAQAKRGNENAKGLGFQICGALWMYWHIRGKHKTAKEYINSFIELTPDDSLSIGQCKALFCLHVACFTLGEIDESRKVATRLFNMAEVLHSELEMAKGLFGMAFGNMFSEFEKSIKYSIETVARFRKLGDDHWLGFALWQNGLFLLISGDLNKAKESYSESLGLFLKTKDNEGKGCAQSGLAMLEFITGNYDKAIELYQDTLAAFKMVGDRPEQARILYEMSWAYVAKNDPRTALQYILDSIQAHQEGGSTRGIGLSMNGLAAIEAVKGNPKKAIEIATAARHFAEKKGVAIELGVNNHGQVYLDDAKSKLTVAEIEQSEKIGMKYSLQDVLEMVEIEYVSPEKEPPIPYEDDFIQKLKIEVEANLSDSEFGVNQLYDAVSMSQMQVYRKLKSIAGQTPSEFIRLFRLEKGREMLTTTDKTIAEIAYSVGFSDPNYFSRCFQKEYRQSPRSFRL